jgi:hypothetical protein
MREEKFYRREDGKLILVTSSNPPISAKSAYDGLQSQFSWPEGHPTDEQLSLAARNFWPTLYGVVPR